MEEQGINRAIKDCNLVAGVNELTQKALDSQKSLRYKHFRHIETDKEKPLIVFSKELNLKVLATEYFDETATEAILNRAEIRYMLTNEDAGQFFGFCLELCLLGDGRTFSFVIAKSKQGYQGYYVGYKVLDFLLRDGGHCYVQFSSEEDLMSVVYFCYQSITAFNKEVDDIAKLDKHLQCLDHC